MPSKVEICGVNTSKLPLLTEQQKKELFERIKQGDMEARREFIYGNLRLVLSIMHRFGNRGENADDLFQIGCIGLIKALDNFDTSHDVKFSTYADGKSAAYISKLLFDKNIPTPAQYKGIKGNYGSRFPNCKYWSISTINRIIVNEQYMGMFVMLKQKVQDVAFRFFTMTSTEQPLLFWRQ